MDTTAHEVKQLAKADEATVRLSSPFWNMDWGLNQSQQKIYLPFINK